MYWGARSASLKMFLYESFSITGQHFQPLSHICGLILIDLLWHRNPSGREQGNEAQKALHHEVGPLGKLGALLWILEEFHYIFSILHDHSRHHHPYSTHRLIEGVSLLRMKRVLGSQG